MGAWRFLRARLRRAAVRPLPVRAASAARRRPARPPARPAATSWSRSELLDAGVRRCEPRPADGRNRRTFRRRSSDEPIDAMAVELKVPAVGESITEVQIGDWLKSRGRARRAGRDRSSRSRPTRPRSSCPRRSRARSRKILKKQGDTATVGEVIGYMEDGRRRAGSAGAAAKPAPPRQRHAPPQTRQPQPAPQAARRSRAAPTTPTRRARDAGRRARARRARPQPRATSTPTGPGGRLLKEDVAARRRGSARRRRRPGAPAKPRRDRQRRRSTGGREEEVVPMSPIRRRIAERLVEAQQHGRAAHHVQRNRHVAPSWRCATSTSEAFQEKLRRQARLHVVLREGRDRRAEARSRRSTPRSAATTSSISNYYDIGIAVGGGKGLVVPVLRNAERMSFAEIEQAIADFGRAGPATTSSRSRSCKGGTFTITNGGVYGSLLSTPIVNPPQSGILGLHAIQERPVARERPGRRSAR